MEDYHVNSMLKALVTFYQSRPVSFYRVGWNTWPEVETSYKAVLRKFRGELPTFHQQRDSNPQPQDYRTAPYTNAPDRIQYKLSIMSYEIQSITDWKSQIIPLENWSTVKQGKWQKVFRGDYKTIQKWLRGNQIGREWSLFQNGQLYNNV